MSFSFSKSIYFCDLGLGLGQLILGFSAMLYRSNSYLPALVYRPNIFHNCCCFFSFSGSTQPGSILIYIQQQLTKKHFGRLFSQLENPLYLKNNMLKNSLSYFTILINRQMYNKSIYTRNEVFSSSKNEGNPLQILQRQVNSTINQFFQWKQLILQIPASSSLSWNQGVPEICFKLDTISKLSSEWCQKFQREIGKLKEKVDQLSANHRFQSQYSANINNDHLNIREIHSKLESLQKRLKISHQRQTKLEQTLSVILKNHNSCLNQSKKLDSSLNTKTQQFLSTKEKPSLFSTFQTCGNSFKPRNNNEFSRQIPVINNVKNLQNSNIYLLEDSNLQSQYSIRSNPVAFSGVQAPHGQYVRTFCNQNNQKVSLKQVPNEKRTQQQIRFDRKREGSLNKRNFSLDKHEHRLNFMKHNLDS